MRLTSFAVSVLAALGVGVLPAAAKDLPHRPALFKDSRQALAIARGQGRQDVMLLIAATRGGVGAVASKVEQIGGTVRYRADDVDYLRVRVPIDQAMTIANLDRVESVAMDYDDDFGSRLTGDGKLLTGEATSSGSGDSAEREWPPSVDDYPLAHHYSPLKDLNADTMRQQHPTWDGRGVTIAVLDGNLDMMLPEFQTAYSLDGKPIPKFADYLRASDPIDDGGQSPQWVNMRATVAAKDGRVSFEGKTFSVPKSGTYRIGLFNERRFTNPANAAYIDQDIDRNGNPRGDDGLFGVLWDEKTNQVWVDTNRNLDFNDETALTDYIKSEKFGVFGKDNPATPVRDSVGFAVQTDRKNKFVAINVGIYQHATIIMGSVVGNREPNGRVQGVAPGARLVSIMWSPAMHGMFEGMITAFRHPKVDLIVLEQSAAMLSMSYTLADARHPFAIVSQRLADKYQKLMFVPGANAPWFGMVAEDGLASNVVSVGGYQSAESYRMNKGFLPEFYDNLHWGALSHGPSGAGALKPDLISPSGQMSTDPGYRLGSKEAGLYQLPPGYTVDGGTSTATPMAAGAAALVLSAAKQTGVPYDAVRLKAALTGSARYIPRLPVHEQGNGLIQVNAAYELLKQMQKQEPIKIVSEGPVKHVLSHLYVKPDTGYGLYEREGWKVGDKAQRTVTFTRTGGPKSPMTFAVKWIGNDGTFSSADSITLPLGKAVSFVVNVSAQKEGAHSAIISLEHESLAQPAHRMLNTVVVAHRFSAENGYTVNTQVTPPVPGDMSVFVEVPEGAEALMASLNVGNVRMGLHSPGRDNGGQNNCVESGGKNTCWILKPAPGVWEINLNSQAGLKFDPAAPKPLKATPVSLTASILDVGVNGAPTLSGGTAGQAQAVSLNLTNRLAKVKARAASVSLGSALEKTATIAQGEQQIYEVIIPEGTTSLRAKLSDVGDARADLDLYLVDCSEQKGGEPTPEKDMGNKAPSDAPNSCNIRAKSDDPGATGEAAVANPKPGRWLIVVDAFSVPAGNTSYSYADVFEHPQFGALTVSDVAKDRDSGASWSVKANAWAAELPAAPRRLKSRVVVDTGDFELSAQ